jgi:hypothetical protein
MLSNSYLKLIQFYCVKNNYRRTLKAKYISKIFVFVELRAYVPGFEAGAGCSQS